MRKITTGILLLLTSQFAFGGIGAVSASLTGVLGIGPLAALVLLATVVGVRIMKGSDDSEK